MTTSSSSSSPIIRGKPSRTASWRRRLLKRNNLKMILMAIPLVALPFMTFKSHVLIRQLSKQEHDHDHTTTSPPSTTSGSTRITVPRRRILEDDLVVPKTSTPPPMNNESAQLWQQALRLAVEDDTAPYQFGSYTAEYPLAEFLAGPAAPFLTANGTQLVFPMARKTQQAICEFRHKLQFSGHFPHSMQQLYRCFSWWQANPHKTPVLLFNESQIPEYRAGFIRGFIQLLQDAFGVQVQNATRTRRSKAVYPLTEGRNPIKRNSFRQYESNRIYYQMHSLTDVKVLREGLYDHYNFAANIRLGGCSKPKDKTLPVIGILNRQYKDLKFKQDGGRRLVNRPAISAAIKNALNTDSENVTIHYLSSFDGLDFLQQVEYMSQVDVLVTPHGAQLTSAAFLPECAGMLELFPRGYYYPEFFGTLAASTGHGHLSIYTGPKHNRTTETDYYRNTPALRRQARLHSITANPNMVALAVQELVVQWRTCCARTEKEQEVEEGAATS